jgi:3-oxoacyl-[acyl-carrier protein] reductase
MDLMLKEKVAIITGAGRGIGRETARLFAIEGAQIIASDIDEAPCLETCHVINQSGGISVPVFGDIADPAFPERVVKTAIEAFGPNIDVIVNNAGYGVGDLIENTSDLFWKRMHEIHVGGPFRLLRAACVFMKEQARKSLDAGVKPSSRKIINVSSFAATDGLPGSVAYSSAKAAMLGLTKSLAKELGGFNICVNAVAFGLIETRLTQPLEKTDENATIIEGVRAGFSNAFRDEMIRLTPLGRSGTVREAAGSILMLASSLSEFITGQVIKATGGL